MAEPNTVGMMSAGAAAQTAVVNAITADALATGSGSPATGSDKHATTVDPETGDVVTVLPQHTHDSASAPVGLSTPGSSHNTSSAAGASGSVTCGGASASVLGLLESIFGLRADHGGALGPLANVQDYAWRLSRMPGFAPD